MSELWTPEQHRKLAVLHEEAALDYLDALCCGDSNRAIVAGEESIVLGLAEDHSYGGLMSILGFELFKASNVLEVSWLDVLDLQILESDANTLKNLVHVSTASVRPGGVYDRPAIIDGFFDRSLETTVA